MDEPRFQELADGVHVMISPQLMSNCTLIASGEGVLVVDAPYTRALAEAVGAYAARLSPRPIRWVVSTHYHGDHILHLEAFVPPAELLAHACTRENIATYAESERELFSRVCPELAEEYSKTQIPLPATTYTEAMSLYLGGREVRLWHPGHAHTNGDTIVELPAERLAVVADLLFVGMLPVARSAHLGGWVAALKRLEALPLETIVPGHGPVSTRHDLADMRCYLDAVRAAVQPYAASGAPVERALAEIDLAPYTTWPNPERIRAAIERAYAEYADGFA
jgi:cyclase